MVNTKTRPALQPHNLPQQDIDSMKQVACSSRTADKFVVRLPDGMRSRIAEMARHHHRSMNSEIIARLECSLLQRGANSPPPPPLEIAGNTALSGSEQALLQIFRQLSGRQQNALLALFAQDMEPD